MVVYFVQVFEEADNFNDAVKVLANTPSPAPVYLIVGGVGHNQGAVITKNREKAQQVWYLGQNDRFEFFFALTMKGFLQVLLYKILFIYVVNKNI